MGENAFERGSWIDERRERGSFCVLEAGELVRISGEFRGCFVRRVFRVDWKEEEEEEG